MLITLFVNASSGGGTDGAAIEAALRGAGATVDRHPFSAVEDVDLTGADRIAVASGDGGIGLAAGRALDAGLPLAVIPSGTANDFARMFGIPLGQREAARLAASPGASIRPLDLAQSGTVPFVNAAASGLSVIATETAAPLKAALGPVAYGVGAVAAAVRAPALEHHVVIDGVEVFAGPAWQIIVSASGAFGDGSRIGPVHPNDLRLDVTVLVGGSRAALPLRAWGMKRGGLTEQDGVEHFRGRDIRVDGAEAWNVDGELCHREDCGHFSVRGAVEVVVP